MAEITNTTKPTKPTKPTRPTEHQRIKLSEIDQSIFRPNDKESEVLDSDNSINPFVTVYTLIGKHDALDENGFPLLYDTIYERDNAKDVLIKAENDDLAYAKKSFNTKRYNYHVKTNNRGDLYNPHGMYESANTHNKKHVSGDLVWRFQEVNLRVFELYLSFLKTNNKAWLMNAERILR